MAVARPNGIGWAVVRLDRDGESWSEIIKTGLTHEGAQRMADEINGPGDYV
jgi:hypothetical protein